MPRFLVLVATREVIDFKLNLTWVDAKWSQWEGLTKDPELEAIVTTGQAKLVAAHKRLDKGKGKGLDA